jgi:hypothetical protein
MRRIFLENVSSGILLGDASGKKRIGKKDRGKDRGKDGRKEKGMK